MDFVDLVNTCAPEVGVHTMSTIVRVESRGNPWAIFNNTTKRPITPPPPSYQSAVIIAKELIDRGHNLDLGYAGINSANLKGLNLTVEQVMEPCTNLRASSQILRWFYAKASATHGPGQKALLHALSGYNTGSLYRGDGYVKRVIEASGGKYHDGYGVAQSATSDILVIGGSTEGQRKSWLLY